VEATEPCVFIEAGQAVVDDSMTFVRRPPFGRGRPPAQRGGDVPGRYLRSASQSPRVHFLPSHLCALNSIASFNARLGTRCFLLNMFLVTGLMLFSDSHFRMAPLSYKLPSLPVLHGIPHDAHGQWAVERRSCPRNVVVPARCRRRPPSAAIVRASSSSTMTPR